MRKVFFILFALTITASNAQRIKYFTSGQAVTLRGEQGPRFGVESVNGIRWKSWCGGVGVALDNYGISTLPVFLHLRKEFLTGRFKPFVYASGGFDFILRQSQLSFAPSIYSFVAIPYHQPYPVYMRPGSIFEAGAGIAVRVFGRVYTNLSVGYSGKKLVYEAPDAFPYYSHYDFSYQRLAVKLGVSL